MARALRNTAVIVLKLAVSSLALSAVFRKADADHILHLLKQAGPFVILASASLYVLAQVFSTLRWRTLLFNEFSFRRLFALYMIGSFFNSFLPGLIGGDAVKAYYLSKDARKVSTVLATVFMDRYIGFVALISIGMIAFPFSLSFFSGTVYVWLMPSISGAFLLGSLLFFGLRIGRRLKNIGEVYGYFSDLRSRRPVVAQALSYSVLVQLLNILMVVLLSFRMNAGIPALSLFVFLPIVIAVTSLPISISGLGVREGAFVILLGLIGVSPEAATSLSLAWFVSSFIGSLPGLGAYLLYSRAARKGGTPVG